jgi:hypothetical protein
MPWRRRRGRPANPMLESAENALDRTKSKQPEVTQLAEDLKLIREDDTVIEDMVQLATDPTGMKAQQKEDEGGSPESDSDDQVR